MLQTTTTVRRRGSRDWLTVIALVLGLPIIIALMLYAFLAPSFNSGPEDLPLAVSGPAVAVTQLEQSLRTQSPDAFEFERYGDAEAVETAVTGREAIGGIAIDRSGGTTIYTAAGNGTPYPGLLNTIASGMREQGESVESIELAPLTDDDPTGIGLATLSLPLAFGGMASAALMIFLLRAKPWHTLIGLTATSIVAGLVVAWILQYGYGSVDADYLVIAAVIAAGVAATSFFVAGLGSLIGIRAIGLGAILTIFIANPLSGLATGWWWLPDPWGTIGRYMPIGADGHLLRSIAFFDGNDAEGACATLIVWILVGVLLLLAGGVKNSRPPTAPPPIGEATESRRPKHLVSQTQSPQEDEAKPEPDRS